MATAVDGEGALSGYSVPPYYDSLVAKIIVHGTDREHAIRRMLWALDEFVVEGIKTTIPMQRELLASDEFREFRYYTKFLDSWLEQRQGEREA